MEQCDGLINFRSGNQGRKRKKKTTGQEEEELGQKRRKLDRSSMFVLLEKQKMDVDHTARDPWK